MAWLCPKCKKLQHGSFRCKFCYFKNDKQITSKKLLEMKKYKMPDEYWERKRKG